MYLLTVNPYNFSKQYVTWLFFFGSTHPTLRVPNIHNLSPPHPPFLLSSPPREIVTLVIGDPTGNRVPVKVLLTTVITDSEDPTGI